jgi:hypothetical protein
MWGKLFAIFEVLLLLLAMLTLQACFEASYPEPVYPAYAYGPTYGYLPAPGYGDYDEHHVWHDRDWWVGHHHAWVEQHHRNWLTHHDHDRD